MSFDKIKAMRNAERFLAQGKIRAAISEYKRVVENDPKDFGTLNILGDLYIKNSEEQEAVGCFTQVAEHYNTQGFSQKAIAVYNKISRLKPGSMEVSAKLAQLYKSKGSFAEARTHFTTLAEEYQRKGQKIEALAIWKQIAELDAHDTGIYLKIAELYWQEDQKEDAAKAFTEAGQRLSSHKQYESALAAFARSLEINKNDLTTLRGYIDTQIKLDYAEEAAKTLEDILVEQPYARDVLFLLIDCYIETGNCQKAEEAIIKLVEREPANYPKFLELIEIYLKENDFDSAARILSMASEHLLVGGQSEQFLYWTNEILARNPEHLDALRLAVRYHGWHRDESELRKSLENLAEVARSTGSVDDEKYALSQLVMIAPLEVAYAQRWQEIKAEYGFEEPEVEPVMFAPTGEAPKFATDESGEIYEGDFSQISDDFSLADGEKFSAVQSKNGNGSNGFALASESFDEYIVDGVVSETDSLDEEAKDVVADDSALKPADERRLEQEVESVEFYIAQGYKELAEKSLSALESEFGTREDLAELRAQLDDSLQTLAAKSKGKKKKAQKTVEETVEETVEIVEPENARESASPDVKEFDILSQFKNELGFEEAEADSGDYETHYHMAIAYKEMGLMEEAIREFQDAINLVKTSDGTRRFFQCCNLLGHCFMEKAMPNLALMWYRRGLEAANLNDEEKQALYYEIANAYETGGDAEKAIEYFEKIYAENVDYRDVSARLQKLR